MGIAPKNSKNYMCYIIKINKTTLTIVGELILF